MTRRITFAAFLTGLYLVLNAVQAQVTPVQGEKFADPPLELKSRPLWFWNKTNTTPDDIREIMTQSRDRSGYYGFGILPAVEQEQYLTDAYFTNYAVALETASKLGLKMCLYDEYWFPSGSAGGQFAKRFPNLVMKRLDMKAIDARGPAALLTPVPEGAPMGAVALNPQTFERIDISSCVSDGKLAWNIPAGKWKVLLFSCVPEGNIMDYMNREATEAFLRITHEEYFKRFSAHFGATIDSVFYDEPTLYRNNGRAWTETFNKQFERKYGKSPVTLYPALWMDMGPETSAARVALFGFRAELFSTQYIGVMDDWCRRHKVRLTGHMDQEQVENVTLISGDLMKVFEHQAMPGVDEVFAFMRTQRAYKIISSAAYNWDKEQVMSETYGGIDKMPVEMLYRMGMDLYAKGINLMVPHAVWTDPKHIIFQPELSWRDPLYGPALVDYNKWIGRLNLMLTGGRHVADIAVLYPVAALQAGSRFDAGTPYEGGPAIPEADYMKLGEMLSLDIRRDFTYLHPEVFDGRCSIDGRQLRLNNKIHAENYQVLVLPGAATAYASNIAKARQFFDAGGRVIATTRLPVHAAEFGQDARLQADITHMFGVSSTNGPSEMLTTTNTAGGKAWFLPSLNADTLRTALDAASMVYDVTIEPTPALKEGNFTYIHVSRQDREVYFLANSSLTSVDTTVSLRGRMDLEQWNPHTGVRGKVECQQSDRDGQAIVRTRIHLEPCSSMFLVGKQLE